MNKQEIKHYEALLEYSHHPTSIGIEPSKIESFLIEPVWFQTPEQEKSLCDIIFILNNDLAIPTEIKRTEKKRDKAISQIEQGIIYCEKVLYRPAVYGVIAYYRSNSYEEYSIFNSQ